MLREQSRWAPAAPSSLIYRRNARGELELLGAMYMAGPRATPEELDARVPISVARWHKHVNYCFPDERRRISETKDGKPLFGPVGTLADESGPALPGVTITVNGPERRTTLTNERGEFRMAGWPAAPEGPCSISGAWRWLATP